MTPLIAKLLRYGLAGAGVATLAFGFIHHQRQVGARKLVVKLEKKNDIVVKKSAVAGNKSRDPGARGMLDPYASASN